MDRRAILCRALLTCMLLGSVSWSLELSASGSDIPTRTEKNALSSERNTITSTPPLPTTNQEQDKRCHASWTAWYAEVKSWSSRILPVLTTTLFETTVYESIRTIGNGSFYTVCDGINRFRFDSKGGHHLTTTTSFSVVKSYTHAWPEWDGVNRDSLRPPKPTCRLSEEYCFVLWNTQFDSEWDREWFKRDYCSPYLRLCDFEFGNEVVLLYWPSTEMIRDVCHPNESTAVSSTTLPVAAPMTFTTNAITFRGRNMYPILHNKAFVVNSKTSWSNVSDVEDTNGAGYNKTSVLYGDFTFVSPTVYIAHHTVLARLSVTNGNGKDIPWEETSVVRTAGTIALQPNDLYSWRPKNLNINAGLQYAQSVANGNFRPSYLTKYPLIREESVPFNLDDLRNPVPASVYYDARYEDCWGEQSHCGTITDDTYQPRLAIKDNAWYKLLPQYADCARPQLFDPPIVLHPIHTTLDAPEVPFPAASQAMPAGAFPAVLAIPTSAALLKETAYGHLLDPHRTNFGINQPSGHYQTKPSHGEPVATSVGGDISRNKLSGDDGRLKNGPSLATGGSPAARINHRGHVFLFLALVLELLQ